MLKEDESYEEAFHFKSGRAVLSTLSRVGCFCCIVETRLLYRDLVATAIEEISPTLMQTPIPTRPKSRP